MHQVLIADNSDNFVDIFTLIFKNYDVSCSSCTFETCFQQIMLLRPGLIIINIKIRGDDGRALCERVKTQAELKHIAVMLMCIDHRKLVNYSKYLADDILEMPFDIDLFVSKVKGLLKIS